MHAMRGKQKPAAAARLVQLEAALVQQAHVGAGVHADGVLAQAGEVQVVAAARPLEQRPLERAAGACGRQGVGCQTCIKGCSGVKQHERVSDMLSHTRPSMRISAQWVTGR